MEIKRKNLLSISLLGIIFSSLIIPAYAEVQLVKTDKLFYSVGDKIFFSGTVDSDSSGLVTIVIRDSNDKFILLTQASIQPDNTFERSLDVNTKFADHGIYNATAFIVNMTEGSLTRFDFSLDGSPVNPSISSAQSNPPEPVIQEFPVISTSEPEPEPISKIASFVDLNKDPQYYVDRYNNESAYKVWFDTNYPDMTIQEAVGLSVIIEETPIVTKIPGFPDPEKDPQQYVDRYNNESAYKEWFDSNFPDQDIYEVVGVSMPESDNIQVNTPINEPPVTTQETSTSMVESSIISPNITSSTEFGQMLLALGGLGILFGAVYGVKRKVDSNAEQIAENKTNLENKVNNNSEQISQNRFWLKKKLMSLRSNDEPVTVIKERLAKGEITVDEYYKLLRALKK